MTPKQLTDKIERVYGFLATDEKELITEFISKAKSEWEKDAWARGWINGVRSIKNSKLNAPEP